MAVSKKKKAVSKPKPKLRPKVKAKSTARVKARVKPKKISKTKPKAKAKAKVVPKVSAPIKKKKPARLIAKKKPARKILPIRKIRSRKKSAASKVQILRRGDEQEIEEKKFYLTAQPAPARETTEELPLTYGRNRIVLLVRDPEWLFTYWEITPAKLEEARRFFGSEWESTKTILRIYDVTNIQFNGGNAHSFYDIEVSGNATTWYLNVGRPDTQFIVDIARIAPSGKFFVLARSNAARTPRSRMSDVVDEEWMSLDFDLLYALSGGLPRGASSAQVRRLVEKGINLGVSSESSPGARKARTQHA